MELQPGRVAASFSSGVHFKPSNRTNGEPDTPTQSRLSRIALP